jgi:hypothetical protein
MPGHESQNELEQVLSPLGRDCHKISQPFRFFSNPKTQKTLAKNIQAVSGFAAWTGTTGWLTSQAKNPQIRKTPCKWKRNRARTMITPHFQTPHPPA